MIVPRRGFYVNSEQLATARKNIATHPWARRAFKQIETDCDQFLTKWSEEDLYACVLSMHGQTFAYGITGCPHCRKPFPFSGDAERAMFSRFPAKTVTCPSCKTVLPDATYTDEGVGLERNGIGYYPIGMWNFYTAGHLLGGVRDHEGMVTKLVWLYMLTHNEHYARRAAVILDAFAAIYPGTIGPRDFTPFGSTKEMGRLHLLTSIVYRVKVLLAHDYDWLYHLSELNEPSPARALLGLPGTMRDNIEVMLRDYLLTEPGGPEYDLTGGNLTELHNHEADGVRAMLAVGLVLEEPDYLKWGIRASDVFLANALGRDGMYFEGSYGYSMFTGTVLLDMSLLSMRADTAQTASHPFGSYRFFQFAVENPLGLLCQGHLPCYGDWGQDRSNSPTPDPKTMADAYRAALHFYTFSPDDALRNRAAERLCSLYSLAEERLGSKGLDLFLSHPEPHQTASFSLPTSSTFTGQAGILAGRDGTGTTILMRVGPNYTHSHDDILGLSYYAYGKEISADVGYSSYGTNGHYGWTTHSIAHNTVVVNGDRTMKRGQLYKPCTGGTLSFLYEKDGITMFEGSAPNLYGVNAYERAVAIVPLGASSYVLDLFYISGAATCDYTFRAFHEKAELSLATDKIRSTNTPWTLAGVDASRHLYYDAPGQSFGERLTTGETFQPLCKGERAQGWTPEPNNGYGFIHDMQEYKKPADSILQADWVSDQGHTLAWYGLLTGNERIWTGAYPTLDGREKHPVLIVRGTGATMQYVAVFCTRKTKQPPELSHIRQLSTRGVQVTALAVMHESGLIDFWVYSPIRQTMIVQTRFGEWRVTGRCAMVRTNRQGKIVRADCITADEMLFQGIHFEGVHRITSTITDIDYTKRAIRITPPLPVSGNSGYVRIARSSDAQASIYPVEHVQTEVDAAVFILRDDLILSKGTVTSYSRGTLHTTDPLPLAASLTGKIIRGSQGGYGIILAIPSPKSIRIQSENPFSAGETFDIIDIESGFQVEWL
ncbi:heparinase II/III-like protein [Aneurinibacillus soli]|uniref:Heparinase II/III-like protein n=1 Tax=Aneurinibacillus soli TaxID=1500254 RepID=A0A0U5AZN0_9BACL|nr:heparinase II/III family protein [Aneurinibacillus soli]PYE60112.1 heparinase II/III-like protein [Aneurinibacillus soli]BAU26399.1 Heparinase II/III-like protein [Aneurinibacillus soli]